MNTHDDMKIPRYVHFFSGRDGITATFNAVTLDVIYFKESDGDLIRRELRSRGFLVQRNTDDAEIFRKIAREKIPETPDFNALKLFLTTRCNFDCLYCVIRNNCRGYEEDMTDETIKNSIDLFVDYCRESKGLKTIMLYGGEPLLNAQGFRCATSWAREREYVIAEPPFEIILETNASLVDEDIAAFIRNNEVVAQVSIDGPREIHDSMRVFPDGTGTFDHVMKGLSILKKHDCKVIVSAVFSTHNAYNARDVIKFIWHDLGVNSTGLDLLHDLMESGVNPQDIPAEDLAPNFITAYKEARKEGLYVEHVVRRVRPFVYKQNRIKDCVACGSKIVVRPDGGIGLCEAFIGDRDHFVKNVSQKPDLKKEPIFIEWNQRTPFFYEECMSCPAISLCGGGCPYNGFAREGSIRGKDTKICNTSKAILEWMIWDLFDIASARAGSFEQSGILEPSSEDRKKILGKIPEKPDVPLQAISRFGD